MALIVWGFNLYQFLDNITRDDVFYLRNRSH